MKRIKFKSIFTFIFCIGVLPGFITSATAGTSFDNDEAIQYKAAGYFWAAQIKGTTSTGAPIYISFKQIIEHFKFGFMGTFEAKKGKWSFLTDVIYLNIQGDKASSIPVPIGATGKFLNVGSNADIKLTGWIINMLGKRNIYGSNKITADIVAGVRYLDLAAETKLRFDALKRTKDININLSGNVWDGVIGVKGDVKFNSRWSIPYYIDIGTGQSKMTWQGFTGLSYAYSWGEVKLLYRYLSWQYKSGGLLRNLNFGGPILGAVYRF